MKYLLLLIALTPLTSLAQTSPCVKMTPEYHLNFVEVPLKYDYSLNSKQLSAITTRKESSDINSYVLGRYEPHWKSNMVSHTKGYSYGNNTCTYVSKIEIELKLISNIHISKDVLPFDCSTKRVLAHEQLHYQIEKNIIEFMKTQLVFLMKKHFDNTPISYNNHIDLNRYVDNQYKILFNDFTQYRQKLSEPFHNKMDTAENYKYESTVCGQHERMSLQKQIMK